MINARYANVTRKKYEDIPFLILLFILFLVYSMFLLQDLSFYMYGYDDFHLIYHVLHPSFTNLLSDTFFNPLQLYQGFLGIGINQRTIHGVFLKLSYMISGVDPSFYHTLRALFFALTGILMYLFTKKITKNKVVSTAAGFLYCSLPVIYDGLRHIGAAEPFSQFFLLLTIYLFLGFYKDKESYKGKQKYFQLIIIFILGVFAIKSRETEIILLPVIGGFLILKYKEIKRNKLWWLVVFLLSLYILPALFGQLNLVNDAKHNPIKITSEKVLTNIKHLLFYNPVTRTGAGERVLVILSLKQYLSETPGSLLGSLGFFIGWYFISMMSVYCYYIFKKKSDKTTLHIFFNEYFTIALLWFLVSTTLMMLYVNPSDHSDIRYIGVLMMPAILVLVSFCYFITEYLKKLKIKHISKYAGIIFVIILFLSVIVNVSITSIYRRGGIGSRHLGMEKSAKMIVEDFYNQSFDNSFFFASTEISGSDTMQGEVKYIPCIFSTNISLSDIIVTNDPFLSFTRPITDEDINKSLSKYGIVYIITYSKPPTISTYSDMQLVKEVDTCEEGYYCRVEKFLKKQKIISHMFKKQFSREPKYFVYKIVRNKISYEKPITILCAEKQGLPKNVI